MYSLKTNSSTSAVYFRNTRNPISRLFELRWIVQRQLITMAPINRHELFVSVLSYVPPAAVADTSALSG